VRARRGTGDPPPAAAPWGSLRPGNEELLLELAKGRHELLFKVTQEGGDFGLAVEAQAYGAARVRAGAGLAR
jgi:hypothetical protein